MIRLGSRPPFLLLLQPIQDTSLKSQIERSLIGSCAGPLLSWGTTLGLLSGSCGSLRLDSEVLTSEKRVLLTLDGEQRFLHRTELSDMYPALDITPQDPEGHGA